MPLTNRANSEKQVAASQANGRQSQGPATEEGRDRCRSSSLKHGLYAHSFEQSMAALGEDPEEFRELYEDLVRYWQPVGSFRTNLVMRLARALWKLERGDRAETGSTMRQIEALKKECRVQARLAENEFKPRLRQLNLLLEAVRARDFSNSDDIGFAFNSLYGQQSTARSERIESLLFDPLLAGKAESEEDSPEADEGSSGEEAGDADAAAPDEPLEDAAAREKFCAELERLLEEELNDALQTRDRVTQQKTQPSPDEWNARMVPDSWFLVRYQDSQNRQVERIIRLLSRFRVQDELHTGEPQPKAEAAPNTGDQK